MIKISYLLSYKNAVLITIIRIYLSGDQTVLSSGQFRNSQYSVLLCSQNEATLTVNVCDTTTFIL